MKNASTFQYFRSKMAKLTDSQKFWVMNHMAYFLSCQNALCPEHLNVMLQHHLSKSVSEQNTATWWLTLRELSSASLFYKTLRLL